MTNVIQRRFTGGELDPSLWGGTDLSKYQQGAKTLRNFIVKKTGGAQNRPGTAYCSPVRYTAAGVADVTRTEEFKVYNQASLAIEFSNSRIRVLRFGIPVSHPTKPAITITAITKANPAVVTYTGTNPVNGDQFTIKNNIGMENLNGQYFHVSALNTGTKTFTLLDINGDPVDSTAFTNLTAGGTCEFVLTITSPYSGNIVKEFDFAQSTNTMTIVHSTVAPQELKLITYPNVFTFGPVAFSPVVQDPDLLYGLTATQQGTAGATAISYAVTSLDPITGIESEPAFNSIVNGNAATSAANPVDLKWTITTPGSTYNIYRALAGVYGLIGVARPTVAGAFLLNYKDVGVSPDTTETFFKADNPFDAAGKYPSCVAYFQQRIWYGHTNEKMETVWASRIGMMNFFNKRDPGDSVKDDDSLEFTLKGRSINPIRFMVDIGGLVLFTDTSELALLGDGSGSVSPTQINPKAQAYNGSISNLRPILYNESAIYYSVNGIRELGFSYEVDGYRGDNLAAFAWHMFEGHEIVSWCFQRNPGSIVWAVRDDGILVSMTYVKEQQILAWHRHDLDGGFVESISMIQEGFNHVVYMIVKRTVSGKIVKYREKLTERFFEDRRDVIIQDCSKSFDGRNKNTALTVTLTGGTQWIPSETLTLTASAAAFTASQVGKQIQLWDSEGKIVRLEVTAFTSTTVVSVKPKTLVPEWARASATSKWGATTNSISDLYFLEGKKVAIRADGYTLASPNNSKYPTVTVAAGKVELGDFYGVVHVGLPITSDLETLSIDTAQGPTVGSDSKLINEVKIRLRDSVGGFVGTEKPAGNSIEGMREIQPKAQGYSSASDLINEVVEQKIDGRWDKNGYVVVRQVDPQPIDISTIAPSGIIPYVGR